MAKVRMGKHEVEMTDPFLEMEEGEDGDLKIVLKDRAMAPFVKPKPRIDWRNTLMLYMKDHSFRKVVLLYELFRQHSELKNEMQSL